MNNNYNSQPNVGIALNPGNQNYNSNSQNNSGLGI